MIYQQLQVRLFLENMEACILDHLGVRLLYNRFVYCIVFFLSLPHYVTTVIS